MTEPALESDHEGHLRALTAGGVDFVVIGGIAVMAHGFVRATADTDITANPEMANRADTVELDDLSLRICSYADLVAMKEATARAQDRLDLAALREARAENS